MGVGRQLEWGGEQHEDLLYWGSDAEARVALDATFGKYLPAQYNTWDDLHTDEALAALCLLCPDVFNCIRWSLEKPTGST